MDNRRIPISVSVHPSDYAGRTVRLGESGNSDIRDKMNLRMRDFEQESKKWREQFLSGSQLSGPPQPSILDNRPRMQVNFPDFPELSSGFSSPMNRIGNSSGFGAPAIAMAQTTSHKSFIEEDDHGNKKYKMVFDIGDFKPSEIQVKTEGRLLAVKGDREVQAGSATESKQFNREITLPDFVEPTSVTSFLSDGVLTLEAPVLLDRLGYNNSMPTNNALQNSTSSTTMRNSPFRDIDSPSRLGSSSLLSAPFGHRDFRKSHDDMLGMGGFNAGGGFNTPFFTDMNFSQPIDRSKTTSSTQQQQNHQQQQQQQQQSQQQGQQQQQQQQLQSASLNSAASYKFNMSEFRPEDISITVTDTTLKIHALREETDGGSGKTYREFKREIGLPEGADVKRLKNALQPDGTLNIEIPVQDNANLRPPHSPSGIDTQFDNFSLNEKSSAGAALSASSQLSQQSAVSQQNQQNSLQQGSGNVSNASGLIDQTNDGKELKLTFDLTGYKPEDLSIKVIDNNTLKVHAVHIDNSRGNQIHREYTRQYILPDGLQPELLRARMSENGTLTVEVPLPQMQPNKYERIINIQNTNR